MPLRTVLDCAEGNVDEDLVRQAMRPGIRRGLFERTELNAALCRLRRGRDAATTARNTGSAG